MALRLDLRANAALKLHVGARTVISLPKSQDCAFFNQLLHLLYKMALRLDQLSKSATLLYALVVCARNACYPYTVFHFSTLPAMRRQPMTDLASATAAGIATKIAGLSAPAILAAIVVMAITPPKTFSEFVVGLISTVMASLSGGAALVRYLDLTELVNDPFGLATIGGMFFVCGLPGWLLVRAFFLWAQRRRHMDIAELLKDAKRGYRNTRSNDNE